MNREERDSIPLCHMRIVLVVTSGMVKAPKRLFSIQPGFATATTIIIILTTIIMTTTHRIPMQMMEIIQTTTMSEVYQMIIVGKVVLAVML